MTSPNLSRILITTSRNPTQQMRTLINDLAARIPNTARINRGKSNLTALAEKALEHGADRIIIADRWKEGPGMLQLFTLGETGLEQRHPLIYMKNVKLRREFGHTRSVADKNLALQTDAAIPPEAQELADTLVQFLNIPKQASTRAQTTMHLSLNYANRIQITFFQTLQKTEIGPRITVSHLVWKPQE